MYKLSPQHHWQCLSDQYHATTSGACSSGVCKFPVVCGNGIVQDGEECECASGTDCKFCTNCKLATGKECSPESKENKECCDAEGLFATTKAKCTKDGKEGYCHAGVCSNLERCNIRFNNRGKIEILDSFCGTGADDCIGKCRSSTTNTCFDTSEFATAKMFVPDGAYCMNGQQRGMCKSGVCGAVFTKTTKATAIATTVKPADNAGTGTDDKTGNNDKPAPPAVTTAVVTVPLGKQCNPDSKCCDKDGRYATTSVECVNGNGKKGYCNAGKCSQAICNLRLGSGDKLDQQCGVSASKVCVASCGSSRTGTCIETHRFQKSLHLFVEDNAVCKDASTGVTGRCSGGECLAVKCGNGIIQGDEECECLSGTDCKFCTNCKLATGKECSPESLGKACCDAKGLFASTTVQCTMGDGQTGYCNAGSCTVPNCKIDLTLGGQQLLLDTFCSASAKNNCAAICRGAARGIACSDSADWGPWALAEGAYCFKSDVRGRCNAAGICVPLPVTAAPVDVDECAENKHDCHNQATCTNTNGGFTCKCKTGYVGDGKACTAAAAPTTAPGM